MSMVLYVGGSKDGTVGSVPQGFTKSMLDTALGPEIYVERLLRLISGVTVRVMALDTLGEEIVLQRVTLRYAD